MERKKTLWIFITVALFITLMLLVAILFLNGGGRRDSDPASLDPKASPRISNPEDYLRPEASPTFVPLASPGNLGGELFIIGSPSPQADLAQSPQPLESPTIQRLYSPEPVLASPKAKPSAQAKKPLKPQPAKAPSEKPKVTSVNEYWIQAASFKSRGKAEDLRSSIAESGLGSVIATKEVDGQTYYRVRIGPYQSQAEARGWLERIRKLEGCGEAYVSKQSVKRAQ